MRSALLALACAAAAVAPAFGRVAPAPPTGFPGWPARFEGSPLRELPLTPLESAFAAGFPGRIARFSDGPHVVVLRWVAEPTRRLHPAADCFRGAGYKVHALPPADGWGRFHASRPGERLLVRERISDASGASWTEPSAWFWAAALRRTPSPWMAATVVEPQDPATR